MTEDYFLYMIDCMVKTCKWMLLQVVLFYLTPYIWNYDHAASTLVLMALYTIIFVVHWNFANERQRVRRLYMPYAIYVVIAALLCMVAKSWDSSLWQITLMPLYGASCFVGVKLFKRIKRKLRRKYRWGSVAMYASLVSFFVVLKGISVAYMKPSQEGVVEERTDIIARRDYLQSKLLTAPKHVINLMPSLVGKQFQGEWALYSCSMLSASLVNISELYPDTRDENLQVICQLIEIVMSPELRRYDAMRWGEDPLETLEGSKSHVSYLSHLAWMICGYKQAGGDDRYDELLASLCATMNRRILNSMGMNLQTYPGELVYVPDMLVAIVALNQYADMNSGKYGPTVQQWLRKAQREWIDKETGLLVSFLLESGSQVEGLPIKGSYSALNCYYLTLIDKDFAHKQYTQLKSLFWKNGLVSGLKEYWDRTCLFGLDIDAGPILLELSPSGTAFFAGPATYFGDEEVRHDILTTAEAAGHTIEMGDKRHYLLANVALVGEAIMLAMRTHTHP